MSFLLRLGNEVNTARALTSRSILANRRSTGLSQDQSVGVKCIGPLG